MLYFVCFYFGGIVAMVSSSLILQKAGLSALTHTQILVASVIWPVSLYKGSKELDHIIKGK